MNEQEINDLVKEINKFYERKNRKNNFYRISIGLSDIFFTGFFLGMFFAQILREVFNFEYYVMYLIYGIVEAITTIPFCMFYFTVHGRQQVDVDKLILSLQAFPDSEETKELLSQYYADKSLTKKESFKKINVLGIAFLILLSVLVISFIYKMEFLNYAASALMIVVSYLINKAYCIKCN